MKMSPREYRNFVRKIHFNTRSGCWEWTASRLPAGYGRSGLPRISYYAHRVAYAHWRGEMRPGMVTDHACLNKSCVNPYHLREVSQGDNVRATKHLIGPATKAAMARPEVRSAHSAAQRRRFQRERAAHAEAKDALL